MALDIKSNITKILAAILALTITVSGSTTSASAGSADGIKDMVLSAANTAKNKAKEFHHNHRLLSTSLMLAVGMIGAYKTLCKIDKEWRRRDAKTAGLEYLFGYTNDWRC